MGKAEYNMNYSSNSEAIYVYCSFCNQDLTGINGVFCPSCGHTIFKNALFSSKSKSTANYDPLGIYTKPWKDKPLIKARVYPAAKEKPQPWIPTMRQPRRAKKVSTLFKKPEKDAVDTTILDDRTMEIGLDSISDTPNGPETESVPNHAVPATSDEPEIGI